MRHLSYRGTNFCILCRRSLPPGIGTTLTLISASLSFWKPCRWPDRNFLRCKRRWKSPSARSGWLLNTSQPHSCRRYVDHLAVCGHRPDTADDEFHRRYSQYIQKNFTIDHTSESAGAGLRASNFNRCNDATVRTWEVSLVHASCDVITLSRTRCRFTQ